MKFHFISFVVVDEDVSWQKPVLHDVSGSYQSLHDLITCKYVCPWRLINTHRFISCRNDSYANWDFSDNGLFSINKITTFVQAISCSMYPELFWYFLGEYVQRTYLESGSYLQITSRHISGKNILGNCAHTRNVKHGHRKGNKQSARGGSRQEEVGAVIYI